MGFRQYSSASCDGGQATFKLLDGKDDTPLIKSTVGYNSQLNPKINAPSPTGISPLHHIINSPSPTKLSSIFQASHLPQAFIPQEFNNKVGAVSTIDSEEWVAFLLKTSSELLMQSKPTDSLLTEGMNQVKQKTVAEPSELGLWEQMASVKGLAEDLNQRDNKAQVLKVKSGPPYNVHNPSGLKPKVQNFMPSITYIPIQLVGPSDPISSSQSVSKKSKEPRPTFCFVEKKIETPLLKAQ